MITVEFAYVLLGLFFAGIALRSTGDRSNRKRIGTALFWGLLAVSFLLGSHIGDFANGCVALALVALGGCGALGQGKPETTTAAERRGSAERRGNALFVPALIIPAVTLAGTLALPHVRISGAALVDPRQVTLVSLAVGVLVALAVSLVWLRPPLLAPLEEGRRLADSIGWTAMLPQLLAALGAIFTSAGVGAAVGQVATHYLPLDRPFEAVIAYCCGMALFTVVMGNAFAAFPVMTAALGLPLIVHKFGGNPAIMGAIGMLAGFCGTLMTPMAANFNIVPAALLELPDRNAVVKAQIPTALPLLLANIVLMYCLVFRF